MRKEIESSFYRILLNGEAWNDQEKWFYNDGTIMYCNNEIYDSPEEFAENLLEYGVADQFGNDQMNDDVCGIGGWRENFSLQGSFGAIEMNEFTRGNGEPIGAKFKYFFKDGDQLQEMRKWVNNTAKTKVIPKGMYLYYS